MSYTFIENDSSSRLNKPSITSHWLFWSLIATCIMSLSLLNAWLGFPIFSTYEGQHDAFGGVIPYSDAQAYFGSSYVFSEFGYLTYWSMRRPLNTIFLTFLQKLFSGNFWYIIGMQVSLCTLALALYLRTIQKTMGTLATLVALAFFFHYAKNYIHTTLSEPLGLTLGTVSFVLLWNGFRDTNKLIFNAGIATLAMALAVRTGPVFMVPALLFLVFLKPFSTSPLKDVLLSFLSFLLPFLFFTSISYFFGTPEKSGAPYANFSYVIYGLVNGGKTWLFALQDPTTIKLLSGKTEAQQATLLYKLSWETFKENPFLLCFAMVKYLGGFIYWFIRQFSFGNGFVFLITTSISVVCWIILCYRIYLKRISYKKEFLFLTIIFIGIAASSMFTWKDGGIRIFAVAIPLIGAFLGFAFSPRNYLPEKSSLPENIWSCFFVSAICLSIIVTPYVPNFTKTNFPDISHINLQQSPHKEVFLTYKPNQQPHLLLNDEPGSLLWRITPLQLKKYKYIHEDTPLGIGLTSISLNFNKANFVLLSIFDYLSHSQKYIVSERNILNIDAQWVFITAELIDKTEETFYKTSNYMEIDQK